ncbi:MAG TPA: glycosyltransferase family 9 protein, partial [Pirellulales bacterium]
MSRSSDPGLASASPGATVRPRPTRRVSREEPAGETVVIGPEELLRRTHDIRELARGDSGYRPRYRYRRPVWNWLFSAIDALGWLAVMLANILRLRRSRPHQALLGDVRSLLLIQFDHLGDGVLTGAVLPALRRRFPDASITALVSPSCEELFRRRAEIDEVVVCDRNRFSRSGRAAGWLGEIFRQGRSLRPRSFDAAIDFRGEFPHALLMWLSGARIRVGWDCGGGGFLLTHHVAYVPHRHEVLSRWAVLAAMGVARPRRVDALGGASGSARRKRTIRPEATSATETDKPALRRV